MNYEQLELCLNGVSLYRCSYTTEIIDADWNERSIDAFQKRPWLNKMYLDEKAISTFKRERDRQRENERKRPKYEKQR